MPVRTPVTALERYIALAIGLITIIGFLWRIAYSTGQLVQRIDNHIIQDDRIQGDHENRLRVLEHPPLPRRRP